MTGAAGYIDSYSNSQAEGLLFFLFREHYALVPLLLVQISYTRNLRELYSTSFEASDSRFPTLIPLRLVNRAGV